MFNKSLFSAAPLHLILFLCIEVLYHSLVQICTMHSKGIDTLSREIHDHIFTVDVNDNCDYKENTKNYNWTEYDFITLNINIRGLYSKISNLNQLIEQVEASGSPP